MKRKAELAFVTGAGSGIGRATALRFADMGAEVIPTDIDLAAAQETARLIRDCGGQATAYWLDVSDAVAFETIAATVRDQHGVPDVVVNNAGTMVSGAFLDLTDADWQRMLGVHLMGVISGSRIFAAQMAERGRGGHIVNLASAGAFIPIPYVSAYCTAKAAIKMVSECMRMELAAHGIGVTAMCFGAVHTAIAEDADVHGDSPSLSNLFRLAATWGPYIAADPDRAARAITDAVRRNQGVVPFRPEAWLFHGVGRLMPGPYREAVGLGVRVTKALSGR